MTGHVASEVTLLCKGFATNVALFPLLLGAVSHFVMLFQGFVGKERRGTDVTREPSLQMDIVNMPLKMGPTSIGGQTVFLRTHVGSLSSMTEHVDLEPLLLGKKLGTAFHAASKDLGRSKGRGCGEGLLPIRVDLNALFFS